MSLMNGKSDSAHAASYSVPQQARQVLIDGVLNNPLISKNLPVDAAELSQRIKFHGSDFPSLPVNWRFAESVSALKGLEAIYLLALLRQKYSVREGEVSINTDHAQLFIMSTLLFTIDPDGDDISFKQNASKYSKYFPDFDHGRLQGTLHRMACTNIYKTKDGKFFHLHGSMNPDPSLDSIGLPHDMDAQSIEESWQPFVEKMSRIDSAEMQRLASDEYKQAGTICWTTNEYKQSEHGKANANVGLFEIREHSPTKSARTGTLPACWWPASSQTAARRPLAGLKVVDITRVIAAPAITRGLAEMGASVMRVTAPHLNDYSSLHCDLNWGKWNCSLDFRNENDRTALHNLILEADVVVTAYRPYVLDKWGLSEQDIIDIADRRGRGIVYVRENCYGWRGPWSYRSGWQQISDANCGVSMEFGRAMGNDEPVTPVFPNSDYCTGIAGVCGILEALMRRGKRGGSYSVDVALNYYSQWLVSSVGTYPDPVWQSLWARYDRPVFRHYHNMSYTIPRVLSVLDAHCKDVLFRESFFEVRDCKNRKTRIKAVKPILEFDDGLVELKFNVGTRPNGVDAARWPEDLSVEVVV